MERLARVNCESSKYRIVLPSSTMKLTVAEAQQKNGYLNATKLSFLAKRKKSTWFTVMQVKTMVAECSASKKKRKN